MSRFVLLAFLFLSVLGCDCAVGQMSPGKTEVQIVEAADKGFHRQLILAAIDAAKSGEIKRVDVIRLRIGLMSPAFREHCEDLAVTQMYFSGGDLPMTEAGVVDRASIDWGSLAAFLEKLLPLILKLLEILK